MNYMQQPMQNPEDISDPTTAMNMALVLMAKAYKQNYTTLTNNNQIISSNPHNRQITQSGNHIGYNAWNHNEYNNGLIVVLEIANQNGNGNVVATRAEGNVIDCSKGKAKIQLQAGEFDLMVVAADCEEIEEVNANCILMANLYMFAQEEQCTELLESTTDTHLVQQDDSNVIPMDSSMDPSGGDLEQHLGTIEETRAFYESLYNNLVIEVEKVNTVNRKTKEANVKLAAELARYRGREQSFEFNQPKFDKLKNGYKKFVYQEQCLTKKINALRLSSSKTITTLNEQIANLNNQLSKEKSMVIKIFLWCVDSGCTKHMTENMKLLINFVWKFIGTARFGNDHVAAILEVSFRRNTCFVKNLDGVDLLKGNCSTNLCTINLHKMTFASPICVMARATSTKSWLWHQRLSHLNFDTITTLAKYNLVTVIPKFKYLKDRMCPSCEQGKSKKIPHKPKPVPNSKNRLHILHTDLCGPMRFESINGKWYVLQIQVLLQAPVIIVRTDNETGFTNQELKAYFEDVGISHQTSSIRTPKQNGVVERRNQTVYNQRIKKFMETMNVTFDELSTMGFEQRSSKPDLQGGLSDTSLHDPILLMLRQQ
nr:hypothetical protein [Tanacetum cinerariifolium]